MSSSEPTAAETAVPHQPHHNVDLDPTDLLPYRPTNTLAIVSLVLGIFWIFGIGSVLAIVFGYVARAQIRKGGECGKAMAVSGIVLGCVGIVLLVGLLVLGPATLAPASVTS